MQILRVFSAPVLWALAALALAGCGFKPKVPDAVIACGADRDCPSGFVCHAKLERCCRPGACQDLPNTSPRPTVRPDAGEPSPSTPPDAALDSEAVLPPAPPAGDADPLPASDAGVDGGDGGVASLGITCSGAQAPPADLGPGQQVHCTIRAHGGIVDLALHSLTPGDPASARNYGACWARLPLAQETTDATGAKRPLSAATLERFVAIGNEYKAICERNMGRFSGVTATAWARDATNQNEIRARIAQGLGVELDIYPPAEEATQLFLGVTRMRKNRVLIFETVFGVEVVYWTKGAPAPTRVSAGISWEDADRLFLSNPTYPTYDSARRALRSRIDNTIEATLVTLEAMVAAGELAPGFVVGPANGMIPLAIAGSLRDEKGAWASAELAARKVEEARVTASPYGRIFGLPITADQVDAFFEGIDAAQFLQLRAEPVRIGYSGELFYVSTVMDLLADEVKATEFAFVFASPHLGYLLHKVLAPR